MVKEDIEELKRFGQGINGSPEKLKSNTQSSLETSRHLHFKEHAYRLMQRIPSSITLCFKPFKKIKQRVFSKTRLESIKFRVLNKGYVKVQLRNPSPEYFTRLIETKKQIGDTTIIIRKRVHFQVPSDYNQKLSNDSTEPSLYYYHQRLNNHQVILKNHQDFESLFDLPMVSDKTKYSFKDRVRLFFLRF
jgi:hypothetical protein